MTNAPTRITAGELVVVLSHYDLGVIHSVRRFRGGSRASPKVFISASAGEFLLKRRGGAEERGETHANVSERVAFSHQVQMHLVQAAGQDQHFPLPPLQPTRDGRTMLDLSGTGVYELFGFVRGERYARDLAQAQTAGALLARLHLLTHDLGPVPQAVPASYHARPDIEHRLARVRERFADPSVPALTSSLLEIYLLASERAEALGIDQRPLGVVHGDWHPGNMLFRKESIAAVVDMDSTRFGRRVLDVANGALQFAIVRKISRRLSTSGKPRWRIVLGPDQLAAFCAGYRTLTPHPVPLAPDDWRALPWLMVEALIVEALLPIAATGRFGSLDPVAFLTLVERTARSLIQENARLAALVGQT